jgi:hypothetical protein
VVVLHNDEHLPFSFVLDKSSYDATPELLAVNRGKPVLDISPCTGTVPAGSQVRKGGKDLCMQMLLHCMDWLAYALPCSLLCVKCPSVSQTP